MTQDKLNELGREVVELSRAVGRFILDERKTFKQSDVEIKGFNNFVSYVDKEAEIKFVNRLSVLLPESGFIAEEGTSTKKGDEYNWIIDPLDGTTNFVHNIPFFCTSVALMKGEELILGVIYEPNVDECYYSWNGIQAFRNEEVISVTSTPDLLSCLLATGFPYDDFERQDEYFDILKSFTHKTRGLRRLGSAALDLAYVACGKVDAFYEYGLNPWDVAAGAFIVKQAGGQVTDFRNTNEYVFGEEICASNQKVHQSMIKVIGDRLA
jgi:myo-inositol-1(or 4)-monophosphatase